MPTGYTAKLMEHGQTFEEFVLGCAKAFGACITMRDDPADAPIPEKFEPNEFYAKSLADARARLAELDAMSPAERLAFGKSRRDTEIKQAEAAIEEDREQNARIDEMVAQVNDWVPPSSEHEGLKRFMLEQLDMSREKSDYWKDSLARLKAKKPQQFYSEAVESAMSTIDYRRKSLKEEEDRTENRNTWIRQLRESLACVGAPA